MATVESMVVFVGTVTILFLARSMCDPSRAGLAEHRDRALQWAGRQSLRGSYWRSIMGGLVASRTGA